MIAPSIRISATRYFIPRDSCDLRTLWIEGFIRDPSSWPEGPAVPVRRQVPVARAERIDLQRLRQLGSVQAQTQRSDIDTVRVDFVAGEHYPLAHTRNDAQRFFERIEVLVQTPERDPVLTRQRVIGQAVLLMQLGYSAVP